MKAIRILLFFFAALVVIFLLTFNRRNIFRQFHPGMSIDKYNCMMLIYGKIGIIDSQTVNNNKQLGFNWENYKVYSGYFNPMGAKQHVEQLYFAFLPASRQNASLKDFHKLVDYFKKQYDEPTAINIQDTTRFGYDFAAWTNRPNETIKLEFNRDTTGWKGKVYPYQFLLTIKPTRPCDSAMQKAEWDKREHRLGDTFTYPLPGWTFSSDPKLDNYFKRIIYAHNRDSVMHFAQEDFSSGRYYLFSSYSGTHFNNYARKKYDLIMVPIGDVRGLFPKTELYNETMLKLLRKKGIPTLFDIAMEVRDVNK